METIKGTLFLYSDMGGGYWAIQDERLISKRGDGSPYWDYDGLHPLRNGDHLKIFNPDGTIYWEGDIGLKEYPDGMKSIEASKAGENGYDISFSSLWIQSDQMGIDRTKWAYPFMKQYQGELTQHGK